MNFVLILEGGDVRECRRVGGTYVHVLNSAWVISVDDPRITSAEPCTICSSCG
jgi:hypothetical protein